MKSKQIRKEKLHIAMIGAKRVPSREGGVEIVVEELAARMVRRGHAVTVYNRRGHHVSGAQYDAARMDAYRGIRLKSVPTLDKKGLAAMTSSFFAALAASFGKYDVVHFHAEGPAFMCFLPKLTGKKVIVTVHGLDHKRAKWGRLGGTYILMGEKNAVRFADEIIVLSRNVQDYFLQTYGRRTRYIPNGVKRPAYMEPSEITERFGLEKNGYILFLGRLVPEKGLRCLLEAFRNTDTDKKLVIAGGSSDTAEFEQELRKKAAGDPRICFTGFVQGRVLEELYGNAYVYVLPSDLEGMPLSLLEAMSHGCCCLTSDIPECTEVVGKHAVTFRRGDAADLEKQLQRLCDEPDLAEKYRQNAAEYICRRYDWERTAEKTLRVYRGY